MFLAAKNTTKESQAILDALNKSLAVIEFKPDGTILTANANFLGAMGYTLDEIQGKHHRMFAEPSYAQSNEYKAFWEKLGRGEFLSAEYKRLAKGGREIWIQASYNPIVNSKGQVVKVIKFATDITEQTLQAADYEGQIRAIGKSQAVIEFNLDGTILTANANFLNAMGYTLDEVQGKHHRIFAEPSYAQSDDYRVFWEKLGRGEYQSGEYKRIGKGGNEVWIQASYNPIADTNGKPFKVVEYATDITEQTLQAADYEGQIRAIGKSQAVIEFNLDGTILTANANFLNAMGYTLDEIQGKHHRIFAEPSYAQSDDYRVFWEKLGRGEYQSGEYKRIGKGGNEVWIQASYNPIADANGKPFKVVKYATDISRQMKARVTAANLTENALSNVQTVASAAEQMFASIQEISQSLGQSKKAVDDIVKKAGHSKVLMERLEQTSSSMENVVGLISDIAEKVNLLALNATIEAARAGDAGKGFAVVAGEVKNLATQTSQATNDIFNEIKNMQSVVGEVSESTELINQATSSVNDYVTGVASAMEEQTTVTNDISSNMQSVSGSVAELDECVKQIAG